MSMKKFILTEDYILEDGTELPAGSRVEFVPGIAIDKDGVESIDKEDFPYVIYAVFVETNEDNQLNDSLIWEKDSNILATLPIACDRLEDFLESCSIEFKEPFEYDMGKASLAKLVCQAEDLTFYKDNYGAKKHKNRLKDIEDIYEVKGGDISDADYNFYKGIIYASEVLYGNIELED